MSLVRFDIRADEQGRTIFDARRISQLRSRAMNSEFVGGHHAEKVVLEPPVSVKKSINPDFLISMEDGKRYRSLKRHLTARGLTPAQYREKWSLPVDYPLVAPNYSKARSELAKALGLGQTRESKKGAKKRAA